MTEFGFEFYLMLNPWSLQLHLLSINNSTRLDNYDKNNSQALS